MLDNDELRKRLSTVRDVVYRNLMKEYLPFPIDKDIATKWAHEAGVKRGGSTIIYTSYMYQMASVFRSLERLLPSFGSLGRIGVIASLGSKLIKPSESEIRRSSLILGNIYRIVRASGKDAGYLYEDEPYSGALLYELGFLDEFKEYGKRLLGFFRERGVREIITVDPHTTFALENYRRLIGFDLQFTSYLELEIRARGSGRYVIHDSCIYSRLLDKYDTIRQVASAAGIEVVEDERVTGRGMGFCCGGPLGPLDSELSEEMARARANSLKGVNEEALVFCPLCYENLSPYMKVKDFAEVISL